MISKELLTKVLQLNLLVDEIKISKKKDFITYYLVDEDKHRHIKNIYKYELAHKCKEWAFYKGYYIDSGIDHGETADSGYASISPRDPDLSIRCKYCDHDPSIQTIFTSSEIESVFDSAQWILKNK